MSPPTEGGDLPDVTIDKRHLSRSAGRLPSNPASRRNFPDLHYARRVPANPFLVCDECSRRVKWWHDKPGPLVNQPCGHTADYRNLCPSWGPVDGCCCESGHHPTEVEA